MVRQKKKRKLNKEQSANKEQIRDEQRKRAKRMTNRGIRDKCKDKNEKETKCKLDMRVTTIEKKQ